MSRQHGIGTHKTTVARDALGTVNVTYHQTIVAKQFKNGAIELSSGGWRTVTTKRRMNQALRTWGSRYLVYQRKGNWYVRTWQNAIEEPRAFIDGMLL
jgi:hypothetical protein